MPPKTPQNEPPEAPTWPKTTPRWLQKPAAIIEPSSVLNFLNPLGPILGPSWALLGCLQPLWRASCHATSFVAACWSALKLQKPSSQSVAEPLALQKQWFFLRFLHIFNKSVFALWCCIFPSTRPSSTSQMPPKTPQNEPRRPQHGPRQPQNGSKNRLRSLTLARFLIL